MGVNRKRKAGGTASHPAKSQPKEKVAEEGEDLFMLKSSAKTIENPNEQHNREEEEEEDASMELRVNTKYAKAFLERKRKEELSRLEKRGALRSDDEDEDESDSETEDEDGDQLTPTLDADIQKTLRLIRKRDPAIYDKSIAFFKQNDEEGNGSESSSDDDNESSKKKKKTKKETKAKPLYYKDLVRQQVIAGEVDSDNEGNDALPAKIMTYGEEQAKLKQDFLSSLKQNSDDSDEDREDNDDDELDGGLFTLRKKTEQEEQQEAEEYESFRTKYGTSLKKDEMDPEAFLQHYLSSEGWKEKKAVIPHYEDIVKEDEEDAEELERMEEFEHSYNFRFEEEGGGVIQTYSRNIEDSMRREDDARKRKRAERKERKALERLKKEEELRRLKNLKQAEIQSKLEKVAKLMGKKTASGRDLKVQASDLEGDFDPETYDKRMQEIFDEEYYNDQEDPEVMEKPTWDDEEDKELFAGLPVDSDDEEGKSGAVEAKYSDADEASDEDEANDRDGDEEEQQEGEEDEDEDEEEWKNMTVEEMQRAKQKYLDELYALDYEDLIGDIKCRFKYRQVHNNDFGLTVEDIMAADDKDLKQLVSLKRMAPYLENEYQVDRKKLKKFKKQIEENKEQIEAKRKKSKQEAVPDEEDEKSDKHPAAADNGEVNAPKKRDRTKKAKQSTVAQEMSSGKRETKELDNDVDLPKKKKRRSKKNGEKNVYASTGLSSSRLESYKLTKPKK